METVLRKMMTNEMTVDFNVLNALIKNIIMDNVNDNTIFIVNMGTSGLRGTHASQEPTKL